MWGLELRLGSGLDLWCKAVTGTSEGLLARLALGNFNGKLAYTDIKPSLHEEWLTVVPKCTDDMAYAEHLLSRCWNFGSCQVEIPT